MLKGAAALGALAAASGAVRAQSAGGPTRAGAGMRAAAGAQALPPRGQFLIRGAAVLTMDPSLGDFVPGDVRVNDGVIVAVGRQLDPAGASPIMALEQAGLLRSDVQLVHPLLTTPEERAVLKMRDVRYSTSPAGEARRPASVGVIQLAELLEAGVKVSLSTDHTTNSNCDPFVALRLLFALHQHRVGAKVPLTLKRLVQLATLDGAVDLGLAGRTGSLTPGKRADIILVRTTDINMTPLGDPYEALVSRAQPTNIDTVIVDGRILRQAGKFTALDHAKVVREAQEAALALRAKANWPPA
jgi:cytosine/adenosine deaminase-related metal-dependent hydrolase